MTKRHYVLLYIVGLGIALGVATFQQTPGYMDADYYLLGGEQLAKGQGFTEPILWNYLDDPTGIPHPSHAYWMPLASILSAIGMILTPFDGFAGGRIVFLFLAGFVSPLTAWLAWQLYADQGERTRRWMASLAGVLALFPGFYLTFLTVPDAFAVYMLCGTVFLVLAWKVGGEGKWEIGKWLGLGALTGLMHLTRADGFLWLGTAFFAMLFFVKPKGYALLTFAVPRMVWCLGGYFLIMGPWLARNFMVFGTPLAPGGGRAFWMLNYDELFSYPASLLTFDRWWSAGLGMILQARGWAVGQNLQTLLGVQGQVFLLPLMVWGLWQLRNHISVKTGALAWGLTFLVMTVVFPFSGARGGFFHSGAAVQPLFWAVVPAGLEAFVRWGGRVRGWRVAQAQRVFGIGLVGVALVMTGLVAFPRMFAGVGAPGYADVELFLVQQNVRPDEVVMVNNPPGYYLASGRPAIVIPNGDLSALKLAAEAFRADLLVVDENVPLSLQGFWENPVDAKTSGISGLEFLGEVRAYRIFRFVDGGGG